MHRSDSIMISLDDGSICSFRQDAHYDTNFLQLKQHLLQGLGNDIRHVDRPASSDILKQTGLLRVNFVGLRKPVAIFVFHEKWFASPSSGLRGSKYKTMMQEHIERQLRQLRTAKM